MTSNWTRLAALLSAGALLGAFEAPPSPPMRTIVTNGYVEHRPATAAELALDAAEARADAAADAADRCATGPSGEVVVAAPGRYGRDQRNVITYCEPLNQPELRRIRIAALKQARDGLPTAQGISGAEAARARRQLDAQIARLQCTGL